MFRQLLSAPLFQVTVTFLPESSVSLLFISGGSGGPKVGKSVAKISQNSSYCACSRGFCLHCNISPLVASCIHLMR